ncbi:metal ABC transporter permease [Candidatus Uhrbacteria bacterium]|nr:metal ABC transporter permease [Candidatus Uhrbacteria bacterium]
MVDIFQYDFIVRGLAAGLIIGSTAPLIGIFLVLRRYSLIADTLAHISLAGIAVGLLLKIDPLLTALGASTLSSLAIERLRESKKIYGESALSLFLSGGLALAVLLIGLSNGLNADLFSYLFGSIVTVRQQDVFLIAAICVPVACVIILLFKELVYLSFDEEAARASGIPTRALNMLLIVLAAIVIALSIPVIGILLVSALLVLPVVTAIQLKKSFVKTLVWAECFSLFSVVAGIAISFYADLPSGATIVLLMFALFLCVFFSNSRSQ